MSNKNKNSCCSTPPANSPGENNCRPNSFWHEKWSLGETPWSTDHADNHLLERYVELAGYGLQPNAKAFVPLCGDALAVSFLHEQGHHVAGIDLVEEAIDLLCSKYFSKLSFTTKKQDGFLTHQSERLELIVGDFFKFSAPGAFELIYDRASLIAIDPKRRTEYGNAISKLLAPGGILFLESVEFDGGDFEGPPNSIDHQTAHQLFDDCKCATFSQSVNSDPSERFREAGVRALIDTTSILQKEL